MPAFLAAPLRRPTRFLTPILAAALAAAGIARLWPPRYQATAILRVERADPGASIEQTILDDARLEKLVGEPDSTPGGSPAPPSDRVYQLRANLAVHARGPDTYAVDCIDEDPQRAADVLQRLTVLLTEESGVAAAAGTPAPDPLAAQLAEAKRELEEKEASHGKTPVSEADLLASSRELLVLQKRYLALLNQKMAARTSTSEPSPPQKVSFRVEVPPRRPEQPITRGGRPVSWGVMGLGVLLGWGLCLRGGPRPYASRVAAPERSDAPRVVQKVAGEVVPASGSAEGPVPALLEPGSVFIRPAQAPAAAQGSSPEPLMPVATDEVEPGSVFLRAPRAAPPVLPDAPASDEVEPGAVFLRAPQPARAARPLAPSAPERSGATTRGGSEAGIKPGSVFRGTPSMSDTQPIPIPPPALERTEARPVEPITPATPPPPESPAAEPLRPARTIETERIAGTTEAPAAITPREVVVPEPVPPPLVERSVDPPSPPAEPAPMPRDAARSGQASVPGLVVSGGTSHGAVLVLAAAPAERLIGAASHCHLRADSPNLAPVHARVAWDGFGLSLSDAGSTTGTYVNGRRIAGRYPLRDGDHVSLGPPGSSQSLRLLVYLPPPSERAAAATSARPEGRSSPPSAAQPTPASATPAGTAPEDSLAPPPAASIRSESPAPKAATPPRSRRGLTALLAILAAGALLGRFLIKPPPPVLVDVTPERVRVGATVFLDGSGFDHVPEKNTVKLGDQTAPVVAAREDRLEVAVRRELPFKLPAEVSVTVEVAGRRSAPGRLSIVAGPHVSRLEPPVAHPGDLVTVWGEQLTADAVTVLVAGAAAEVVRTQGDSLQFRVPDTPAAQEGARLPVDVWAAGEQAERTFLVVGHLPVVTELVPPRGSAGERVTLHGYGFDPDTAGNRVRFGENEAIVLSSSATELVASAPARGPLLVRQAELAVTVEARGATSSRTSFMMLGPPSGMFVPHFYAALVPELPAANHAFVSTELGPLLLLTGPAGPSSPAQRADNVARVLNDLVDEAAKPLALSFEVEPVPSVALTGGHKVVVTATPRDALGYEGLWVGMGKPGEATPHTVATHWTALLQDYLALFVQNQRPTHVLALSPRGQVLVDLYSEARKDRSGGRGVPNQLFARLWPGIADRLRETALLLPAPGQSNAAAVVVGRWQGTMEETDKGTQPIQARFFFEAGNLAGLLARRSPKGVSAETRLHDVSFQGGDLAFALPSGTATLRFKASLREDVIAGVIQSEPPDGRASGYFTLSHTE